MTAFQLSCPPYFQAIVILFWFSNGSGDIVQIPFVSGQGDFVPFSDDPLRYLQAMWVPWLLAALPLAALVLLINAAAIEYGFGIPGLFRLIRAAVSSQDVAVLEAMVVEGVILVVLANFLADAVHARLDPRLSHR